MTDRQLTDRQRAIRILTVAREQAAADLIEQAIDEQEWLIDRGMFPDEPRPWSEESVFDVGDRLVKLHNMLAVLNALPPEPVEPVEQNPLVSEIIA